MALPPDNGGGDPGDDRRIPIPQITADQLGSKARNLGAPPADTRWQQHEQHHQQQRDSVAVYQIDWDTQSNYGDEVVDPELQDKQVRTDRSLLFSSHFAPCDATSCVCLFSLSERLSVDN